MTALTDSVGAIKERYAYSAYGVLWIFDGSGTARTVTAEGNRYTYTGREWDDLVEIYHYRARWYDPLSGRFLSRDPIGFEGSKWNLFEYVNGKPTVLTDPLGLGFFDPPLPSPGGFPLLEKLNALCKKCSERNKLGYCLQRANYIAYGIQRAWRINFGHGPRPDTPTTAARGGYMCYEWAATFHRIGKKCGGDFITSRTRIIERTVGRGDHAYTRFCAGDDMSKTDCCIDVDDNVHPKFAPGFCHEPGVLDGMPGYRPVPGEEAIPGTPMPLGPLP